MHFDTRQFPSEDLDVPVCNVRLLKAPEQLTCQDAHLTKSRLLNGNEAKV